MNTGGIPLKFEYIDNIQSLSIDTKDETMEKPKCYIPKKLAGFYRKHPEDYIMADKERTINAILSVYLDYRCLPTEYNENEPDDPAGLGILELICIKCIANPEFTRRIREVYSNLDTLYTDIVEKNKPFAKVLDDNFTHGELLYYGI